MSAPQPFTFKGNQFRAEDLAAHNTFFVPVNSSIAEAIDAIKRFNGNVFLHNPTFKRIAAKEFNVLKVLPAVEYVTREVWTVTFNGEIVLLKDPAKKDASINVNQDPEVPEININRDQEDIPSCCCVLS